MSDQGGVHDDHPFEAPVDQRDPARRFRGRLAAPVTVITGFLGSGKTTLIRELMQNPGGKRLAIVVNEFGVVFLVA